MAKTALPTVLASIMTAGVSQMASAVRSQHAMEGHIYGNTLTVSLIAMVRTGRAWALGDTADVAETKVGNAILEFENKYIEAGNHVFRDSEGLSEFLAVKRNRNPTLNGPLVRAYRKAAKDAKLTKKEHAIAEVQSLTRKLFKEMTTNHADKVRELSRMEDPAALIAAWQDYVKNDIGASTYGTLKARLATEGKTRQSTSTDKVADAVTLLTELTDHAEIMAIIGKLTERANELADAAKIAETHMNAGRDSDETGDEVSEDQRIAA